MKLLLINRYVYSVTISMLALLTAVLIILLVTIIIAHSGGCAYIRNCVGELQLDMDTEQPMHMVTMQ